MQRGALKMTTQNLSLHTADYIVMILFLIISSVIGIYYGLCKKQSTTDEYLLGGRRMHLVPVAMSLMVTYQSAISILGSPMEIYVYDTMGSYLWISICIANVIQAYLIVPLVHPLKLTSTYEYFGRRFKSRSVQLLGAVLGMLQTLLYMSIVLLAPALALEAGVPLWLSIVGIGVVGTIYTSIGGMRTVIWTDVFQFIVLYGGLIVIIIIVEPAQCTVLIYGLILTLTGLLIYSYFAIKECDPYLAGNISNGNQIVPYFVMHVFWNAPGVAGLFIAALFSGALSSLSSGINAMSANSVQDVLADVLKDATETKKTLIAKLTVIVYGVLAVGLAYLIRVIPGPFTQISQSAAGSVGGPMVGILFLGATFPQANWIGALVGGLLGTAMNIWVSLGSFLYGAKAPISPTIPTTGCNVTCISSVPSLEGLNGTIYSTGTPESILTTATPLSVTSGHLAIYDISYMFFGLLGFLVTFIVGIIISILTGKDRGDPTKSEYIFPCMRQFLRAEYDAVSVPQIQMVAKSKVEPLDVDNGFSSKHLADVNSVEMSLSNNQHEGQL